MKAGGAVAALFVASMTARVNADGLPCSPTGPWVLLSSPSTGSVDVSAVFARLGVELQARGLALCATPPQAPQEPALATIALEPTDPAGSGVTIDIEVRDAVTSKRVVRTV